MASQVAMAVGIACAVSRWGLAATILATCFFAAAAGAIAMEVWAPERRGVGAVLACGMTVGFAVMAVIGAATVFGILGCLVLMPFLFTQPLINGVVKRYWQDRFGQVDKVEKVVLRREPGELDLLDDHALCRVWRESFVHMQSASCAETWSGIVEHRQRCLDELQRRSPDGFAAWLASGAHAAGDPLPYLQSQPPPSTP